LSTLRTLTGGKVYATFFFIDEWFPLNRPITSFKLDDHLRFTVALRAFKNIAIEGQLMFDEISRLESTGGDHPRIRFGNIFITPDKGNASLRVAPPANVDCSCLPPLPNDDNPYQLTRAAEANGEFGLISDAWHRVAEPFAWRYRIDQDRDTNGAGLVYFSNYIAFIEAAEREALRQAVAPWSSPETLRRRALQHRRVGYYGNAAVDDVITTEISLFASAAAPDEFAVKATVFRESDGRPMCRSEAIKIIPPLTE
jgi:probable biosynthetic protein (TIGR04098 family)